MASSYPKPEIPALKEFLDQKADLYNTPAFIKTDPIQVPHQYSEARDIEISAFLTATIAWGQKTTIISNARKLLSWMPGGPYEFLMAAGNEEMERFIPFVHRTFNGLDCIYFLKSLRHIYRHYGDLRTVFENSYHASGDLWYSITEFRKLFFEHADPGRSSKHVADVSRGASAKRINMFLRWMVRRDMRGVDFGLWEDIPMHALYIPLDVHTGNVARKLGLLQRKQNDWKAVVELSSRLREFDPDDPVRYDFALFGLGSFEKF
ncbi:MAG: TIGR02757 family protein [Bacteroidota bacterium]